MICIAFYMPKISIILPTYNERENIEELIDSIFEYIDNPSEIIVVDDNSPDKTWEVVEKIGRSNPNVNLLRRMDERGIASAISTGVSLLRNEIVVWMDCDFSHPPEMIPKLIKALNNYDIAVGSRYVKGGKDMRNSQVRILSSRIINLFASILLDFSIKDYTSGFVAAKREVLNKVEISARGYGEYCIEFLYKAKKRGFKIKEVPYVVYDRKAGETKTSPNLTTFLRHIVVYPLTILKLRVKG